MNNTVKEIPEIRPARLEDLPEIQKVIFKAKGYMRATGNTSQWVGAYPSNEDFAKDIARDSCFVMVDKSGLIHAVFAFIIGNDPTYDYIEGGNWLNNEPYGTIHRMGSDGYFSGVLKTAVDFCKDKVTNVRIDTHEANIPMQNAIKACGFSYCGIIYISDGSPRKAFQLKVR